MSHAVTPSITLEDVYVRFPIIGAEARSFKKAALASVASLAGGKGRVGGRLSTAMNTTVVEALNGITLHIETGARIGLIGHNGAGKSTLLRVMAGIYPPNSGRVRTVGRITSLLDIGLGVDGHATGRENIYLRALYMGRSAKETALVIDDIAEFTGLGAFLDMPVRTYSAGMQARLLFAVSTAFEADILLLDEGIGAGDAEFAQKAQTRMQQFIDKAGILVLASHDFGLLRTFCKTIIHLEGGQISRMGPIDEMI